VSHAIAQALMRYSRAGFAQGLREIIIRAGKGIVFVHDKII
jgi:hypothetical protein